MSTTCLLATVARGLVSILASAEPISTPVIVVVGLLAPSTIAMLVTIIIVVILLVLVAVFVVIIIVAVMLLLVAVAVGPIFG
jgi:hypothetical protein